MGRVRLARVSLLVAGTACATVPLLAALAAGTDVSPVRDLAAELSQQADPNALATAAMLYDSINAHADALELARRAARLASDRADLAWLELQLCTQNAACVTEVPARRLATLDPSNGAPFLHELESGTPDGEQRIDAALLRISQSERIDIYWNRLVVTGTDVLTRSQPAYEAEPGVVYAPALHATGMVAAVAMPKLSQLSRACSRERTEDSTRRDLCLRIARALQRGDTFIAEGMGLGMEERLSPAGSPDAVAAVRRRDELRAAQDEAQTLQTGPEYLPRLIAALRTYRTEREAQGAVLAQYRASGHTALPESPAERATTRNPSTSDAAFEQWSASPLAHDPGRTTMPIELLNVNFLAVIVAALSSFLLGGLWYSRALFGAVWSREAGVNPDKQGHRPMVFVTSYLLAFLAAWLFAALLPADISVAQATVLGALIGIVWVATSFGINYGFGDRSLTLWLIDAGYHTLQFTLYGAIIGVWR